MHNVGITGVGGGVGQSIIKALQHTDYHLIGMDGEASGAGLYAVPEAYVIPYANKDNYIDSLLQICKARHIQVLFPGLDAELYKLSSSKSAFEAIGTRVIVSDQSVIDIAENKWLTYEKLSQYGFKVPHTIKLAEITAPEQLIFPQIIKPYLGGARSKDVFLAKNIEDYSAVCEKIADSIDKFIIQEYLDGPEYTCGTINLGGKCHGVIVMERELRAGDTYKCRSVKNEIISTTLLKLMDIIKPDGACNVQLKLKNGEPYIFEINARCSGTTAARAICGFNEPKMVCDYVIKNIQPSFAIQEKQILRYWQELAVDVETCEQLKQAGNIAHLNHLNL